MKPIKTYLLPLFLLLYFNVSIFGQSNSEINISGSDSLSNNLSKTDSILVNCYFTEKEYNRMHRINYCETADDSEYIYEDELYSGKKHKKRGRGSFMNDIPVDLVVDVVLNTLFFVAILWQ